MRSVAALFTLTLALHTPGAQAADLDTRVEQLARELRCVVCQSQSVAESNAPLAVDMKRQLREGLAAGRSEDELRDELVQRYGEQVLYRPALHGGTAPLWFGPLALLAVGGAVYLRQGRSRSSPGPDA